MPRHHVLHSLPLQQPCSVLCARPSRDLLPVELQRLASLQTKERAQQGSPPGLQKSWPQGLPRVDMQSPHWGTRQQQLPPTSSPVLRLGIPQEPLKVAPPGNGMQQQLLGEQGQPNPLPSPPWDLNSLQARLRTAPADASSPQHTKSSSGSQAAQQESFGRRLSLGRFLSGVVQKVKGHSPLSRQSSVAPLLSPAALPAPVSSQQAAAGLLSAAVPRAASLQGLPAAAPAVLGPETAIIGQQAVAGAGAPAPRAAPLQGLPAAAPAVLDPPQATTGQQALAAASPAAPRAAADVSQGVTAQVPTVPGPHQATPDHQADAGATAAVPRAGATPSQPLPAISEVPAPTPAIPPAGTAVPAAKGAALTMQHAVEELPLPTPVQAREPPAGTGAPSGASSSSGSGSDSSSSAGSSTESGSDSESGSASDAEEAGAAIEGQPPLGHLPGMGQLHPGGTKGDAEAPAQLNTAEGAPGGGVLALVTAEPAGEMGALLHCSVQSLAPAGRGTCRFTFCHAPLQAALMFACVPQ